MNRLSGNFRAAGEFLNQALELNPNNPAVQHSIAECCVKRAASAHTQLEKDRALKQATTICLALKNQTSDSFAMTTLVKIGLLRLKEELESTANADVISAYTKDIEKELTQGLQKFPMDPVLLNLDSQFAGLIMQSERAMQSLKKSFEVNPRNGYVAMRLADCQKKTSMEDAEDTLKRALEFGPFNRQLHYAYAKLLLEIGTASQETLEHHLRRAYTPGDSNYDAQLLLARQLFINGADAQSKALFKRIGNARLPSKLRNAPQYPLPGELAGSIVKMEATYCFVLRDGNADWIYVNPDNFDVNDWTLLAVGTRVQFRVAFSMKGPCGIRVRCESRR